MTAKNIIELERNGPYCPSDLKQAEQEWAEHRRSNGFAADGKNRIIKLGGNTKIGLDAGTLTMSAGANTEYGLCVNSKSCESVCVVNKAGRGRFDSIAHARATISSFLITNPVGFATILHRDLKFYAGKGLKFARLNVNSDAAHELLFPWIETIPIDFYDYTKRINRVGQVLSNYRTTYSATAYTSEATIRRIISRGDTVTMVFPVKKCDIPSEWRGVAVYDGDKNDVRYNDLSGTIIGLSAKGKLKNMKNHPLLIGVS